jgi:hypothetical protein
VRVRWRKRIWRRPEPSCRRGTWTEEHDFAPPRAKLTSRAVEWAVSLLRLDDTTVSAIARRLGVNWHTCWNAVRKHAGTSIDIKKRPSGVKAIGVDEHIWRPSRISSADKAVTVMVDLTRGPDRRLCARLLDAVQRTASTTSPSGARTPPLVGVVGVERGHLARRVALDHRSWITWQHRGGCATVLQRRAVHRGLPPHHPVALPVPPRGRLARAASAAR